MKTGVYKILNKINQKVYIGSSSQGLSIRLNYHVKNLKKNKHKNTYLQRSWNKYGEKNFTFEVIEECSKDFCIIREQFWIDFYKSNNSSFGYNICAVAGSTLGFKYFEEQKQKISKALIGKLCGEKHPMWGKKRIPTMLGKKHTPEAITKMKEFQKNRIRTKEEKQKQKECKNKGEKHHYFGKKREWLGELNKILKSGAKPDQRKTVIKLDLEGNFIEKYSGLKEAADKNNMKVFSKICDVCNGNRKTAGGFKWKYEEKQCKEFIDSL